MTIDLTGGMDPATDEVTSETPTTEAYREGTSMWIWDDAGQVGLPRVGVECVGATWETARMVTLNLALPDGRVLSAFANERPHPVTDADGHSRILGAGPLRFVCVEPFDHWRLEFDGVAAVTTVEDLIAGNARRGGEDGAESTPLRIDIDGRMAAPPWVQGSQDPDGQFIVGEERFEQLFTASGVVSVDGDTINLTGGGLRIHRKGGNRSDYNDFFGHCWQSARFPSGRAFGFIHYTPRPDGSVKYHEGWLMDDGEVESARVVDTPWLGHMQPRGEDVGFTLRTRRGEIRIEGETSLSSFAPERPIGDGVTFPTLQQAIAKYRWDGEEAYGMIERSSRL
ncbi:MAG: hypothetical protein ACHQIG_08975 [Acidimicrobiia bacterium]